MAQLTLPGMGPVRTQEQDALQAHLMGAARLLLMFAHSDTAVIPWPAFYAWKAEHKRMFNDIHAEYLIDEEGE